MFPLALLNDFDGSVLSTDPALTLVLLHFTGTEGSTTFTDSSPIPYTFTNTDGVTVSSAEIKSGFGSNGFFNNPVKETAPYRYLKTNVVAPDLRNTDYTIEFLVYRIPRAGAEVETVFFSAFANAGACYQVSVNNTTHVVEANVFSEVFDHQNTLSFNVLHHIALVRDGLNFNIYIDGVKSTTTKTLLQPVIDTHVPNQVLAVGGSSGSTLVLNGYMDEFRIRKEAIYKTNFTPPTAPFTF